MLALCDFVGKTEAEIKKHVAVNYSDNGRENVSYKTIVQRLAACDVLIAYEVEVGCGGGDSTSFFVFRDGSRLLELTGLHCSCYGFEGQFYLKEVNVTYLKSRNFSIILSADDDSAADNRALIQDYVASLCPVCAQHFAEPEALLVHLDWEMEKNGYKPENN